MKVGFEDWYHGITASKGGRPAQELTLQSLTGKKLQPGRDYFIWFSFDNDQPVELQTAMRFVETGAIDPNRAETLFNTLRLEHAGTFNFHRHYCLRSIK